MNLTINCKGDSGSPLIKQINGRAVLIGILEGKEAGNRTLAERCEVSGQMVMVFTSVPNNVQWIVNTIRRKS